MEGRQYSARELMVLISYEKRVGGQTCCAINIPKGRDSHRVSSVCLCCNLDSKKKKKIDTRRVINSAVMSDP